MNISFYEVLTDVMADCQRPSSVIMATFFRSLCYGIPSTHLSYGIFILSSL